MKKLFLIAAVLFLPGCEFIDDLAHRTLYPWDLVNERINQRNDKQAPPITNLTELPSGGWAWTSKRMDSAITVLYVHGNGLSVVDMLDSGFIDLVLGRNGFNFAVVDYPGVGIGGQGEPTEASLVRMVSEALQELHRQAQPESKVFVWGRSIGAAVAAQVAKSNHDIIDGMVLVSPWTNLKAASKTNWLGRFVSDKFFDQHGYKTDEACKSITKPVLIVAAENDKIVPAHLSASLVSCFANATLLEVPIAGHNDVYGYGAIDEIVRFFFVSR